MYVGTYMRTCVRACLHWCLMKCGCVVILCATVLTCVSMCVCVPVRIYWYTSVCEFVCIHEYIRVLASTFPVASVLKRMLLLTCVRLCLRGLGVRVLV